MIPTEFARNTPVELPDRFKPDHLGTNVTTPSGKSRVEQLPGDAPQRWRISPHHAAPVKKANVDDRCFGASAIGCDEEGVVVSHSFGLQSVANLREGPDVFDVWERADVGDGKRRPVGRDAGGWRT